MPEALVLGGDQGARQLRGELAELHRETPATVLGEEEAEGLPLPVRDHHRGGAVEGLPGEGEEEVEEEEEKEGSDGGKKEGQENPLAPGQAPLSIARIAASSPPTGGGATLTA